MKTLQLLDDAAVVQRVLDHIDNRTTDLSERTWREPVANYRSGARLAAEMEVLRRFPVAFCPSAALPEAGSYLARDAAGTPLLAVRGEDGEVRVFRNACRHRGTQVACGSGCRKAFVCRYHGWTYGLDGALKHVPDAHGFPDLDRSANSLAPVPAVEAHGLVFVTQDPRREAEAEPLPELVTPDYRLVGAGEAEVPANWKIVAEGFLEGYHIRSTHSSTFYPRQFDNLNVVETFGRNNRITFPYRVVNKLRDVPAAERKAEGVLTYVYHLFPNVMVATFRRRIIMVVLEPLATDRTNQITYNLSNRADDAASQATRSQDEDFVAAGAVEDREVVCAIQRSVDSGANDYFQFGRFEGAIEHFHRCLEETVSLTGSAPA